MVTLRDGIFAGFVALLFFVGLIPADALMPFEFHFNEPFGLGFFTAHFIHANFNHALMNCASSVAIWFLVARSMPSVWLLLLTALLPLLISAGFVLSHNEFYSYRGFSGCVYGFVVAGAISVWPRDKLLSLGLMGFAAVKIAYENTGYFDVDAFSSVVDAAINTDAHAFGALGGLILSACYLLVLRLQSKQ